MLLVALNFSSSLSGAMDGSSIFRSSTCILFSDVCMICAWCADEIKQFLASADSDGNGVLSKEEFRKGIVKLGISDQDAAAVVDEVWSVYTQYLLWCMCGWWSNCFPVFWWNRQGRVRIPFNPGAHCLGGLGLMPCHSRIETLTTIKCRAGKRSFSFLHYWTVWSL